jgi:TolB-like protein
VIGPRSPCCRSTTWDDGTARLADGITEDIITDLARWPTLFSTTER